MKVGPPGKSDRVVGCFCVAALSVILCGAMLGAVMGDYGGPPEGAAEDSRNKAITLWLCFGGLIVCFVGARWLLKKPKN